MGFVKVAPATFSSRHVYPVVMRHSLHLLRLHCRISALHFPFAQDMIGATTGYDVALDHETTTEVICRDLKELHHCNRSGCMAAAGLTATASAAAAIWALV